MDVIAAVALIDKLCEDIQKGHHRGGLRRPLKFDLDQKWRTEGHALGPGRLPDSDVSIVKAQFRLGRVLFTSVKANVIQQGTISLALSVSA